MSFILYFSVTNNPPYTSLFPAELSEKTTLIIQTAATRPSASVQHVQSLFTLLQSTCHRSTTEYSQYFNADIDTHTLSVECGGGGIVRLLFGRGSPDSRVSHSHHFPLCSVTTATVPRVLSVTCGCHGNLLPRQLLGEMAIQEVSVCRSERKKKHKSTYKENLIQEASDAAAGERLTHI